MSVQKVNKKAEMQAILTLCHDGSSTGIECANLLVGHLTQDHFVSPVGQKVFRRVRHLLKRHSELPDREEILEDPGLEKKYRDELAEVIDLNEVRAIRRADNLHKLVKRLDKYRKIRALLEIGLQLEEAFDQDQMDPDDVIAELATKVTNASSASRQMKVYSRGDGNTSLALARDLLKGNGPQFIPTGIKAYDKQNSGFPRGTFVTLAATTGGGKSTMISAMSEHMAMQGARVGIVPLEMDAGEMTLRDMARNSKIELSNLINPKERMTKEQRKDAYAAYREQTLKMEKRGGCVKLIDPGGDVDIQSLLAEIKPFEFDVIFIDYIGLLKGAESEGQWRELGNIARYCKVWSGMGHKTTVIMAAQLSGEGAIRYSGAITEHSAYAWTWIKDDYAAETGIFTVSQPKVRQGTQFKFPIFIDSAIMTVRDCTPEETASWQEQLDRIAKQAGNEYRGKGSGKRRSKKRDDDDAPKDPYNGSKPSAKADVDDDDEPPRKKSQVRHGSSKWSPNYSGGKARGNKRKDFVEEEF